MTNFTSLLLVAIVLAAIAFFVYQKRSQAPAHSNDPQKIYVDLRSHALRSNRESLGESLTVSANQPFAVVMDWSLGNGTATVFAAIDGSASIYLSSGGGFIGGKGVPAVNAAAKACVQKAAAAQSQMQLTQTFPLPTGDEVNLYVLTDAGVFVGKAHQSDLETGVDRFSNLANAAQGIVTQYRLHDPK